MGVIYSLAALGILILFGKQISLLFLEKEQTEILGQVYLFLIVNSAFYIPLAFVNIVRFLIQGLGYSRLAVLAGVCEMIARGVVGFFLVPVFGYSAVCFASPAAWIAADAFLIPSYIHIMKTLKTRMGYGID